MSVRLPEHFNIISVETSSRSLSSKSLYENNRANIRANEIFTRCVIILNKELFYHTHPPRKQFFEAYSDSEGSDQCAQMRTLIRAFAFRVQNHLRLSNQKWRTTTLMIVRMRRMIFICAGRICPKTLFC